MLDITIVNKTSPDANWNRQADRRTHRTTFWVRLTLWLKNDMSWVTFSKWYVKRDISSRSCQVWHVKSDISNVICQERHVKSDISRKTCKGWHVKKNMLRFKCKKTHVKIGMSKLTCQKWPVRSEMSRMACRVCRNKCEKSRPNYRYRFVVELDLWHRVAAVPAVIRKVQEITTNFLGKFVIRICSNRHILSIKSIHKKDWYSICANSSTKLWRNAFGRMKVGTSSVRKINVFLQPCCETEVFPLKHPLSLFPACSAILRGYLMTCWNMYRY